MLKLQVCLSTSTCSRYSVLAMFFTRKKSMLHKGFIKAYLKGNSGFLEQFFYAS